MVDRGRHGPDGTDEQEGVRSYRREMEAVLGPTGARRNSTTYTLPERWVGRTKVVELPRHVKNVRSSCAGTS